MQLFARAFYKVEIEYGFTNSQLTISLDAEMGNTSSSQTSTSPDPGFWAGIKQAIRDGHHVDGASRGFLEWLQDPCKICFPQPYPIQRY